MKNLMTMALAALISTACSQSPASGAFEPSYVDPATLPGQHSGLVFPMSLQVSPDFSPEELDGIFSAASRWKDLTGGAADLDVFVGDDPDFPCRVRLADSFPGGGPDSIGEAVGGPRPDGCDILLIRLQMESVKDRFGKKAPDYVTVVEQVMTHELGHVYGLYHLPSPSSIMFWAYDPRNTSLDDVTVDAFCSLRGCPGRAFKTL